uniref:Uncharacterized protein n=1 Tax=Anopheles arabiensis TaxID=7173 RepID=A0A182HXZ0_ANOAR
MDQSEEFDSSCFSSLLDGSKATSSKIKNLHTKALEESVPPSQTSALGLQKKLVGPVALVKLQILTLEELHV